MFLGGDRIEVVFLNMLKPESLFQMCCSWYRIRIFLWHFRLQVLVNCWKLQSYFSSE